MKGEQAITKGHKAPEHLLAMKSTKRFMRDALDDQAPPPTPHRQHSTRPAVMPTSGCHNLIVDRVLCMPSNV